MCHQMMANQHDKKVQKAKSASKQSSVSFDVVSLEFCHSQPHDWINILINCKIQQQPQTHTNQVINVAELFMASGGACLMMFRLFSGDRLEGSGDLGVGWPRMWKRHAMRAHRGQVQVRSLVNW
jgi:hypothetical protein